MTVKIVKMKITKLNSYMPSDRYAIADPKIVGTKLADNDHGRRASKYVLIFIKAAEDDSLTFPFPFIF